MLNFLKIKKMANPKEKIFTLNFKTTDPVKLHAFMDKYGNNKVEKPKYIYWTRFLDNFYTIATLEDTYWDVNKLTSAIYKHMENNITFVIFEVSNSPCQGRMVDGFWKAWKQEQDLTGHFKNRKRSQKLKKLTDYIHKKEELKQKEIELQRRKVELEKSLSLKKKEDELRAKEIELEELEKQLHDTEEIEETPKKRVKWWK